MAGGLERGWQLGAWPQPRPARGVGLLLGLRQPPLPTAGRLRFAKRSTRRCRRRSPSSFGPGSFGVPSLGVFVVFFRAISPLFTSRGFSPCPQSVLLLFLSGSTCPPCLPSLGAGLSPGLRCPRSESLAPRPVEEPPAPSPAPRETEEPGSRAEVMEEVVSCSFNNPLFHQEDKSGITYRIPALLYIPTAHTFLAFAEKRSTSRDEDALHLVLRRGLRTGHSVQWGPQEALMKATLPGHRTMNPCPVWEQRSGRVYLFFICVQDHVTERQQIVSGRNAARLCFICSQDAGYSWSEVRDLTEEVIGPEVKHWATFAVGPGHGIQLQSGRLVIPAYAYYIPHWFFCIRLPCKTRPHSLMIYSDDLGATWHHGRLIRSMETVECEVAEVTGRSGHLVLYCSARTPNRCRAEALSTDHGECFQRLALNQQLCEPPHGCQGSVVSFQPLESLHGCQDPSDKDAPHIQQSFLPDSSLRLEQECGTLSESWLLYSHPINKKRRVDLGIYLNQAPLDAACWSRPWILHCGPCGYSDMAAVEEEGLFGCLFECGIKRECEQIAFRLFTHQEILSHVQGDCSNPCRNPETIQD